MIEALIGKQTAFARTPKYRVESKKDRVQAAKYRKRLGWIPWIEMLIGGYFALTVYYALQKRELPHRAFSYALCSGLLVHGADVAAARPVRGVGTQSGGESFQAFPSGSLTIGYSVTNPSIF